MFRIKKLHAALAGSILATTSCIVFAQDKNRLVIEEVFVTAEKRDSSVQDTAIAITAFNSETMDDLGVAGAADIANYTPGMTYNGSPNRIFIRGVGRVDNSLGSEPGVAIYKDGIYTNEATAVSDNSFFVDRIEILRGPQGTLYGRNAIGGAASIVSKRPTDEFEGEIRVGASSFGGQVIGLSASGPITDNVGFRIAAEKTGNDGWVKNISGAGNQNDSDFRRVEAQFEWDISDDINVWVSYSKSDVDSNMNGVVSLDPYNTTSPVGPVGDFGSDFQQLVPNATLGYDTLRPSVKDIHTTNKNESGYIKTPADSVTAHMSWDTESWQFKYIYGTSSYEYEFLNDRDGTDRQDIQYLNYIAQFEDYDQHEFQAISHLGGDVEFILGLFKYHDENEQPYDLYSPTNPVLKNPVFMDFSGTVCGCIIDSPPNPQGLYYHQLGDLETDSEAVYGQMDYQINEAWNLAVGLRYSKDEKTGYEEQRIIFDGQGTYAYIAGLVGLQWYNAAGPQARVAWDFNNGTVSATHKDDWNSFDGSISVDYQPNDDSLYYAKVATGYKSGGFRLGSMQADQGVEPETLLAYEVGIKQTINDVIQINVAAYFYDYQDMQVPVAAVINGVNNTLFLNAKEAEQLGLEIDAQWLVNENLTFFSTYSYMDTEIGTMGVPVIDTTDSMPEASLLKGNELLKAPPHKFTLNTQYTWYLNNNASIGAVASYVYVDSQWSTIFNIDELEVPSTNRVDFRVTYRGPEDKLRVSAFVRNATDEDIIESISRSSPYFNNARSASTQPPRWSGIEVNYRF
ncbi:MAG: iron complex outermembrane receptor protein [Oceanicoccus sp.]|jgi:iron complex outermembrane receptor protein